MVTCLLSTLEMGSVVFFLSFEHVCTSETETKALWAWRYEPLLTEFPQL